MTDLNNIVNQIIESNNDPYDLAGLVEVLNDKKVVIQKDEFLRYIASSKRLNLYTTPLSVAKFIAGIACHFKPSSVLDPACGLGSILEHMTCASDISGIDLDQGVTAVSKYLHPEWNIINANSLSYSYDRKYDVIVSSFPIESNKVEIDGESKYIQEAFVDLALERLNAEGVLVFLTSDLVLTSPRFKELRNRIQDRYNLEMILSLPQGSIERTYLKPSIVVIKNSPPSGVTLMMTLDELDVERVLSAYQIESLGSSDSISFSQVLDKTGSALYDNSSPLFKWDAEYMTGHSGKRATQMESFMERPLGELADIHLGLNISAHLQQKSGELRILTHRNLADQKVKLRENDHFVSKRKLNVEQHISFKRIDDAIVRKGDILISELKSGGKVTLVGSDLPGKFIVSDTIILMRSLFPEYISQFLSKNWESQHVHMKVLTKLNLKATPFASVNSLKNLNIPVLPISNLNLLSQHALDEAPIEELEEAKMAIDMVYEPEEGPVNQMYVEGHDDLPIELNTEYVAENIECAVSTIDYEFDDESGAAARPNYETQFLMLKEFIERRIQDLEGKIDTVSDTLNTLLKHIVDLKSEIHNIKHQNRDIETKLTRMNMSLDAHLTDLVQIDNTLDQYIDEIRGWFEHWDYLEENSRSFFPSAEYLWDELNKLGDADFSPFVLQYSRVVENELWQKVFIPLNVELNSDEALKQSVIRPAIAKGHGFDVFTFAKHIQNNNPKYTLGQMHFIMKIAGSSKEKLSSDPLMKYFKSYIQRSFVSDILERNFLKQLSTLLNKYRNIAAHPYITDLDKATRFHGFIRDCINQLFEYYKP